jgi:hypothetical protein
MFANIDGALLKTVGHFSPWCGNNRLRVPGALPWGKVAGA